MKSHSKWNEDEIQVRFCYRVHVKFCCQIVTKELEVIQNSGYFEIVDKAWWIYNRILVPMLSLDIYEKTVPLASILLQITNVLEKRMQTRKQLQDSISDTQQSY